MVQLIVFGFNAKSFVNDILDVLSFLPTRRVFLGNVLTLFWMGFFGAAPVSGRDQKGALPKIFHTYPIILKLGTVIPYLKSIQKIYESRDTTFELS